jgi:hypothetical protein
MRRPTTATLPGAAVAAANVTAAGGVAAAPMSTAAMATTVPPARSSRENNLGNRQTNNGREHNTDSHSLHGAHLQPYSTPAGAVWRGEPDAGAGKLRSAAGIRLAD